MRFNPKSLHSFVSSALSFCSCLFERGSSLKLQLETILLQYSWTQSFLIWVVLDKCQNMWLCNLPHNSFAASNNDSNFFFLILKETDNY